MAAKQEHAGASNPQDLTCPLCLDIFDDAALLTSCGHTFCRKCLKRYDLSHQDLDHVVCPLCRKVTKLSANRVDDLPANVTVKKLVNDYKCGGVNAVLERRPKCNVCTVQGEAVSFCRTCNAFMCEICLLCHKLQTLLFAGHEIVSIEDITKGNISSGHPSEKCLIHKQENKDMFCKDCKMHICFKCAILSHRDHKLKSHEDFEKDLKTKVAGLANEEQILITIETHLERKEFLLKGLNAYFDIIRDINCQSPLRALQAIIDAMKRYPSDNQIQISGSASLFHLTRGNYKKQLTKSWRQAVINILLDAIEKVSDSVTLLRNCGLTLFNFSIPEDLQFQFERVVKNLVKLALTEDREGLLQRVYVHMCNSIACHVDGSQKLLAGKLGMITCMLKLIKERLDRKICDEVIETAWSTLWNLTDDTAHNCEIILQGDGMQLFLNCKETFKEKPELLRIMMGLIGNVAEVKALRPQLIPHVPVFASLLHYKADDIEISYNAAGALAHMASDGEDVWKASTSREEVLNKMAHAIESWRLDEQRKIGYRSLEPILRLLNTYHTPQVQLWATWALANLCTFSREEYCRLLVSEGGLEKLENLVARPDTWSRVTYFAKIAIRLSHEY